MLENEKLFLFSSNYYCPIGHLRRFIKPRQIINQELASIRNKGFILSGVRITKHTIYQMTLQFYKAEIREKIKL